MRELVCFALLTCVAAGPVGAETLATVGERRIERADVEKLVAPKLFEIENQRYEEMRDGLETLVNNALLEQEAEKRGVTARELFQTEIADKAATPSDADVQALYEQYKDNLEGTPLEQVRPQLVEYLTQLKGAERQEQFLAELKKKYPTVVELRPPTRDVAVGTRVRGPKDAPITIVEFSDYECPFCRRAEASIRQVLETYDDKIRFAYRDYPLEFHPQARTAAEAGHCANAQGKFWEFHERLMNGSDLQLSALQSAAEKAGLDRAAFDKCVTSREFEAAVDRDMEAATAAGVSGTPAFFINGRLIDGAQPFEAFRDIIEEELAWSKR